MAATCSRTSSPRRSARMTQPETITDLRTRRDAALTSAIAANERLRALDAAIARAQRAGESDAVTKLEGERADATRAGQTASAKHARLAGEARSSLVEWGRQSPEDTVAACSDQLPFALLPVRMETKFARVGDTAELRVRLFPDDIGIAPPVAACSESERGLGEAYWRARTDAKQNPGNTDLRSAYEGAWNALAAAAGAYRASYIVRATTPANPDAAASDLQFNDPAPPQTPPVPRAELLPDRFVVLTYATNAAEGSLHEVGRAVGAAIPDDLVVGPDPSLQDSWLTRDPATGRIVVPDALKWMVDFDAAASVGMAVRVPLSPPYDTAGFD